jgi:hypothetical protein
LLMLVFCVSVANPWRHYFGCLVIVGRAVSFQDYCVF